MTEISRRSFLKGLGATALKAMLGRKHGAPLLPEPERQDVVRWAKENEIIQPQWQGVSIGLGRKLIIDNFGLSTNAQRSRIHSIDDRGGFLVPEEYRDRLLTALKYSKAIRSSPTLIASRNVDTLFGFPVVESTEPVAEGGLVLGDWTRYLTLKEKGGA